MKASASAATITSSETARSRVLPVWMTSSTASLSREPSSQRGLALEKPFTAERLAFSDGTVVFGGTQCPKSEQQVQQAAAAPECSRSRPVSPTGHQYRVGEFDRRTARRNARNYDDMVYAELAAATSDIDAFESRYPTLPGDAEEREEVAVLNRTAALRTLIPLLDTNEDGFIDREEMKYALPALPDADLTRVMRECDLDQDGKVDAEEWIAYVLRKQANCDDAEFCKGVNTLCVCLDAPFRQQAAATFAAADLDGCACSPAHTGTEPRVFRSSHRLASLR